jgi:hypothetical protein
LTGVGTAVGIEPFSSSEVGFREAVDPAHCFTLQSFNLNVERAVEAAQDKWSAKLAEEIDGSFEVEMKRTF